MRTYLAATVLILGGLIAAGLGAFTGLRDSHASTFSSPHPELEYFKAVNRVAPPQDPQLLFLLMAQYSNLHLQSEGVEFISERLKDFGPRLTDAQRSLYVSAIALLRAQNAASVPLLRRLSYVNETIAMLDQAKQLSHGRIFVVNWIAGVVRTELPHHFHQEKAAQDELDWCVANADLAPDAGWLREVYYHRGKLARARGDQAAAQENLQRSGYPDFNSPITLITPFSENPAGGHAFSPRRIAEIVPGRVYSLSGFEFTEYYFVVSADRKELIGIDAGTRPDSAQAAYEALEAYAPGLPKLTTIFITHSHWDHVGGHSYFRALNPRLRFYARSNYQEEVANQLNSPDTFGKYFFGERYNLDDLRSFKPDVTIDHRTEVSVGGTRVELIPIEGGETRDGMFIYVPELGVMFVGDFIMPYVGAPFAAEGNVPGLLNAIDIVVKTNPHYLLHGHEPLTRNFASPDMLAQLRTDLGWLREQVLSSVRRGDERAAIHQANLIPPDLLGGNPGVYLPYYILREHVIDRLYDQNVGYWRADLQGLDHLSRADRADLLVNYLGLSERQLAATAERLVADGKYELAASLLDSAESRFAGSDAVAKAKRLVYLKLMEKYQSTDPFKFIIYSAKIHQQVTQMSSGK